MEVVLELKKRYGVNSKTQTSKGSGLNFTTFYNVISNKIDGKWVLPGSLY